MNAARARQIAASHVAFTPAHIVKREVATWNSIRAETVRVTEAQRFEYAFRGTHHLLIAAEQAVREDGETQVEHLRSTLRDFTGKLTFIPAGSTFTGWQEPRVLMRVTYFYIDPDSALDPELGFDAVEFAPRLFFLDADIWDTARKLKARIEERGSGSDLYAEALSAVLCHELVRLNGGRRVDEQQFSGGLAGWQKKRVEDYVAAHISERVSLSDMAELAHLSPYHFARAFKRSFGVPPHRYHMMLRVEHAKTLLAKPEASVTEIGMRLGFAQTSAFTSGFHKLTGVTPTQYRRALE
ncbi:MAG TPA: AraC family transcriptional regulator [Roseiarcus sp.]|jgi:AraC family transcriptional regulator